MEVRKKLESRFPGFCFLPVLLISTLVVLPMGKGSLVVDVNEDFYENNKADPCNLFELEKPSGYCECSSDLSEVEVVSCGFHKTPSEKEWQAISLFESVTHIKFINRPYGAIKQIPPPYVFAGMRRLNYFTLTNAMLSKIGSFAFSNSTSLADLNLHDNALFHLAENSFANLPNLTEINLGENNLTEINRDVFVNLPKLKELVLSKNGIQIIHDNAFKGLKNLLELALQDNKLSVISREVFTGLQKLKHLELQENDIEYIGDHTFAELHSLQDLDLHQNQILSVSPFAFAGLRQLSRLNLKDNKIVKLQSPETFRPLNSIHFLDLRNNELEHLQFSIAKPIYKNLKNNNMQLLLKGNRFSCGCQILWMKTLYEETESRYVREHFSGVTCNLFESSRKQGGISSTSSYFHNDGSSHDITLLNSPPEATTLSSFDRVMSILNLTKTDFNCGDKEEEEEEMKQYDMAKPSQDTTYSYHHLTEEENEKNRIVPPSHNHRDLHLGDFSSDELSDDKHQDSILNEPQATAALEDSSGEIPQRTTTVHHKSDSSKIRQDSPSSSTTNICDFTIFFTCTFLVAYLNSFRWSY